MIEPIGLSGSSGVLRPTRQYRGAHIQGLANEKTPIVEIRFCRSPECLDRTGITIAPAKAGDYDTLRKRAFGFRRNYAEALSQEALRLAAPIVHRRGL